MCCVNISATTNIPEKGRKFLISPLPFHDLMQHFERSREKKTLPQLHLSLPWLLLWCNAPSSFCTTSQLRRFDKWNGTHLFMAHWFLHLYIPNTSVSTLDAASLSVKQKKNLPKKLFWTGIILEKSAGNIIHFKYTYFSHMFLLKFFSK